MLMSLDQLHPVAKWINIPGLTLLKALNCPKKQQAVKSDPKTLLFIVQTQMPSYYLQLFFFLFQKGDFYAVTWYVDRPCLGACALHWQDSRKPLLMWQQSVFEYEGVLGGVRGRKGGVRGDKEKRGNGGRERGEKVHSQSMKLQSPQAGPMGKSRPTCRRTGSEAAGSHGCAASQWAVSDLIQKVDMSGKKCCEPVWEEGEGGQSQISLFNLNKRNLWNQGTEGALTNCSYFLIRIYADMRT